MKLLVQDEEGRYSLPAHKLVGIKQSYCRRYTIVEAIIAPGEAVRTFQSNEDFWVLAKQLENVTWKKIINDAGITTGPWGA